MTVTLVLSRPPAYSETFFNSKIKGLKEAGLKVILVTSATKCKYTACTHQKHPAVSKIVMVQLWNMLMVYFSLLPYLKNVIRYVKLERMEQTSYKRILEKLYINATLLKLKTDWLHFGFATMALERELVAKAIGAKMAVSLRGYDVAVYPLKHPNCYSKLWKYVDKVHTISEDLYQKALQTGLKLEQPYQKIFPAIDTSFFKSVKGNPKKVNKCIVFSSIGRLHWKKGFIETLQALKSLNENGINFQYRIVGTGDDFERIAFAAYQLGLKDKVLLIGELQHSEIKKELEKTDIYLQYSIQEGFCNAVLEAQAIGKLCIVSDAEGLSENIAEKVSGWVVPRLQPELLAQKIMDILHFDPVHTQEVQEKAMVRVKNSFSLEKQKKEFEQFYLKKIENTLL